MHDLIEARQQSVIVGGQQEACIAGGDLLEQASEHDLACLRIDVRCGFIGQEYIRSIGQRPSHSDTLLLARAQCLRQMMQAGSQAKIMEERACLITARTVWLSTAHVQSETDVIERAKGRQQIECLENIADGPGAKTVAIPLM